MCPTAVPGISVGIPADLPTLPQDLGHQCKAGAWRYQQKRAFCVKDLWEAREKPKPLQLAQCLGNDRSADQNGEADAAHQAATGESACKALDITGAHRIWSLAECAKVDLQRQAHTRQICPPHSMLCLAGVA